ncbi:S8 family serine peptidase [Paucibacter sp. XJ19-41]|uniref:S8 family serine peptidase n=1 Tax=Paucibacter sp. XJ19-41 TaxID=2927824 RepID=UPI00234AB725|nr:S8 family serine peptidase [Paucibacter sp. XJ19-41]MDC6170546.1 S8 family serine peptidase [Paucibacter sp. XJ19-41]
MKLRPVSLAALALFAGLSSQAFASERRTYIVQLAGEPAASYAGGVAGYAPTRPIEGRRFVFQAESVQAYVSYLESRQRSVAGSVAGAPVLANYTTVLNGFSASLTEAEVLTLRANPAVIDIQADEPRQLLTTTTSQFLGLSTPGGLWSQTVGGTLNKGEDIIIGIIDSGIWPENPAFADRVDANGVPTHDLGGVLAYGTAPAGWQGDCASGTGFTPAIHCNNKLIGARYFNAGFNSSGNTLHWTDFASSPRDSVAGATGHGGHGTHTASTAGGNSGNSAIVSGISMGAASGMAPRARLAAYKVCWTFVNPNATDGTGSQNTCYTSDSVAAIERAVQDGVHVLNYSISGSQTSINDPVEQAFLKASNAGVFVAASAGNSGPANAVAHISPWLTTVAASTHDRFNQGDITLGSGSKYSGASLNVSPLGSAPMILSTDAKLAAASTSDANLCFLNTLDPVKTTGKIVVCTRGTNARVEKSLAVATAGGVGMVLADNGAGLVAEAHSVPTVHVNAADGEAIKAYVAGPNPTASISAFYPGSAPAPVMASFSSRGPNMGDGNMLKPDLTAPGVDVIAGVTADLSEAEHAAVANGTLRPPADFASYQGTSMSSPHVAGLAALLKQAHPTWSPAAIKSALMTTASTTLNDGQPGMANGLLPWAQGAGHVMPNKATDPGLVYDNSPIDWIRYQCKVNRAAVSPASDCTTYGILDETYNVNLPSITVGGVVNTAVVTRRVKNVGGSTATYTANLVAPAGFTAVVNPTSLTLASGATGTYTVTLTAAGAQENVWGYGSLTWSDGTHTVKSPVSARIGKGVSAPALLTATTASGSRLVTVRTGFSGRMTANKAGLKAATLGNQADLSPAAMTSAQLRTACTAGNDLPNVKVYDVAVPAGTIVARFALRDADVGAAGDDNDLGLLTPAGAWVYSGNDGSNEAVEVASPAAGNYKVCVVAYGGASTMSHRLSSWVVTPTDIGGKFNVMLPSQVYSNGTATVGLSWSGLPASGRFVGGAQFKDVSGAVQATTVVRVDTGAAPLSEPTREPSARQLSKLD